jgi:hypothetical protein
MNLNEIFDRSAMDRYNPNQTPEEAYYYARKLKRRYPAGEHIIASNSWASYFYALDIIKGPWKMGEHTISQDPEYATYYATDILKKPFPEGEPAIAMSAGYAGDYENFIDRVGTSEDGKRWNKLIDKVRNSRKLQK